MRSVSSTVTLDMANTELPCVCECLITHGQFDIHARWENPSAFESRQWAKCVNGDVDGARDTVPHGQPDRRGRADREPNSLKPSKFGERTRAAPAAARPLITRPSARGRSRRTA
ncbi:hypothetical protein EVAR_27718_1 [Eumeta japonica]|uniref:Uncharacterized protein n=1 Tax=Eumeta variegata TaxID=151549 RepID=A0A4C1WRL8_EUMVA|nr:hypothetical protein EVAR_27718_1 [Eumeta japonica]